MTEKSRTKYIVLGIISIKPATGYDIMQTIKNSTNYFWSESEGQIYPTLAKCVSNGYATCHETTENGRNKKIYTITKEGQQLLKSWLEEKPQRNSVRNEFILKLFFAKNVYKEKVLEFIQDFIDNHHKELQELELLFSTLTSSKDPHQPFWLATLEYGIAIIKAELEWAQRTITNLNLE